MLNEIAMMGVVFVVLIAGVKILVPRMLAEEDAGKRFFFGLVLFGIYTAVALLLFYYFCTFEGKGFGTGEEVFHRIMIAFLLVNGMAVFVGCLYFFTREKRKLTQSEKMKLKDL